MRLVEAVKKRSSHLEGRMNKELGISGRAGRAMQHVMNRLRGTNRRKNRQGTRRDPLEKRLDKMHRRHDLSGKGLLDG